MCHQFWYFNLPGHYEAALQQWPIEGFPVERNQYGPLLNDPKDGIFACEQLAMYYERQGNDSVRATEYARLGMLKAGRARTLCGDPFEAARIERVHAKFAHRLTRLQKRQPGRNTSSQGLRGVRSD